MSFKNQREFFRYRHEKPVDFKEVSIDDAAVADLAKAVTKDISATGMLFTSSCHPRMSSIIAIDVDYRTSMLCKEIEMNALILNNKLLGKVVRIEDNDNGSYDIGIAFIKKADDVSQELCASGSGQFA
ncbi:MAG: PilZ domain-containing protein [Candidatus Omnitrophota bacterium]